MRRWKKTSERGTRGAFTLIELAAVVAILALLASVAIPRFSDAVAEQRARAAAQRVAADVELAAARAARTSSPETIRFNLANRSYQILGAADVERPSQTYTVNLAGEPYAIEKIEAEFNGDAELKFDGYGLPDSGGSVTVEAGGHTRIVTVDDTTGKATMIEGS
jgi:prepilin-type N-terminal cleavage/methylation domain-containing protein